MPTDDASSPTARPAVVARSEQAVSPWVRLVTKTVEGLTDQPEDYHSFAQADYVSVLATLATGELVFVRQFRPALERWTLELPGGLVDPDEDAAVAGERELLEEVGLVAAGGLLDLGRLDPDTGRLENHLWCFAAIGAEPAVTWHPEHAVERVVLAPAAVAAAIRDGELTHALHLAIIGLAAMRGLLPDLLDAVTSAAR